MRAGDLDVRVGEGAEDDELGILGGAFNRMTGQLKRQRADLVEANRQIDDRRLFTEAILFGVSAGVLGLDRDGRIFLPNRSALELLACGADDLIGRDLAAAVPEMAVLHRALEGGAQRTTQGKVTLARGGRARELLVRMTVQSGARRPVGTVVTFDDITELVHAQRTAAWAGVARRVAHEIKNPLTPIQLAAERLKRRRPIGNNSGSESDADVFDMCIDTIVRQVGAIRAMVDEFSAFARMPAPVLVETDPVPAIERAIAMQAMARPDVSFTFEPCAEPVLVHCDAVQVGQAVTNLLQNAVDSIDSRPPENTEPGRVRVRLEAAGGDRCTVCVDDNGRGLPADPRRRARLTEPYVTTRERGTGLGLAIVKKIMDDHGGRIALDDGPAGGARICLEFPRHGASGPSGDAPRREPVSRHER